jgi:hypothetical protein
VVACGLLTPTYGHVVNRPEGWPVDHMPTLRRSVPHKGCAFGLTRFACQTSIFRKEKGVRGGGLGPPKGPGWREEGGSEGKASPYRSQVQFGAFPCESGPSVGRRSLQGQDGRQEPPGAAFVDLPYPSPRRGL